MASQGFQAMIDGGIRDMENLSLTEGDLACEPQSPQTEQESKKNSKHKSNKTKHQRSERRRQPRSSKSAASDTKLQATVDEGVLHMQRLGMERVSMERLTRMEDWRMIIKFKKVTAEDFFRAAQASEPLEESPLLGYLRLLLSKKRHPKRKSGATLDRKFQATADDLVLHMQRLHIDRLTFTERRMTVGCKDPIAGVPCLFKVRCVEETRPAPQPVLSTPQRIMRVFQLRQVPEILSAITKIIDQRKQVFISAQEQKKHVINQIIEKKMGVLSRPFKALKVECAQEEELQEEELQEEELQEEELQVEELKEEELQVEELQVEELQVEELKEEELKEEELKEEELKEEELKEEELKEEELQVEELQVEELQVEELKEEELQVEELQVEELQVEELKEEELKEEELKEEELKEEELKEEELKEEELQEEELQLEAQVEELQPEAQEEEVPHTPSQQK
ncbi:involucrin-like [Penaeus vannamei]|uniref:involucrin-like n=1 Tax=Penaeus vannamei TaxID=6689 RepID=UPI00387F868B